MPRIETYPLDYNITINDFVLGSDGDSLNATKNYKLVTLLDYLGTYYNLQAQDLLYTYKTVASGSVGNGEMSSNNYASPTVTFAAITNFYVSKITAFSQLVDDFINSVAADGLTIMVMDMGDFNNYGVYTITGSSDVDANTIDLAVTLVSENGTISNNASIGITVQAGGGSVDLSNYVTLDGTQTISGTKTFSATTVSFTGFLTGTQRLTASNYISSKLHIIEGNSGANIPTINSGTGWVTVDITSEGQAAYFFAQIGQGVGTGGIFASQEGGFFDFDELTAQRIYTFPNASGTLLLDTDLDNYVDKTSTENISGIKGFNNALYIRDQIIFDDDPSPTGYASGGAMGYLGAGRYYYWTDHAATFSVYGAFDFNDLTANRIYDLPNRDGEVSVITRDSGTSGLTLEGLVTTGNHTIQTQEWWWERHGNLVHFWLELVDIDGSSTGELILRWDGTTFPAMNYQGTYGNLWNCTVAFFAQNFYSIYAIPRVTGSKEGACFAMQTTLDPSNTTGVFNATFGGEVNSRIVIQGTYRV